MSAQVEERVVGLRFDNKDFERNVKHSLSTIDKLQLSIAGLRNGANNVLLFATSLRSITLDPLVNGVNVGIGKLMALTAALTGVYNVTTEVYNKMTQLVRSLGTEQITAGWSKYGDYTQSVQTILSATKKEGESDADALDRVNEQLERLLWFTDETSYNLTDMTSNVGKFTSQGIELEQAVTAMQGIALWSANAGQDVQQASRAMYNLAQSLGTGSVRLTDWMSIENANMATKEFKELAIQAGIAQGTLKKVGNEIQTIGGNAVTFQNFRDTLHEGWLDTASLMNVLSQYGSFAELVRQKVLEKGILATKAIDLVIEDLEKKGELADYELGIKAFEQGQAAITFAQAIESTQDAVSTQFMRIFQAIFGNYYEAKELWSDFAEELYTIFAEPVYLIADVMSRVRELGTMNNITNDLWSMWSNIADTAEQFRTTIYDAFGFIADEDGNYEDSIINKLAFYINEMAKKFHSFRIEFNNFFKKILERDDIWDNFQRFFEGIKGIFGIAKQLASTLINRIISPASKKTDDIFTIISKLMAKIGDGLVWISDYVEKTDLFNVIFEEVGKVIAKVVSDLIVIRDVIKDTLEKFSKSPIAKGMGKTVGQLPERLAAFGDTATRAANIATKAGDAITTTIDNITDVISVAIPWFIRLWQFIGHIVNGGKEVFGYIKHYGGLLVDALKKVFDALRGNVEQMTDEWLSSFSFGSLLDATPIANFIQGIISGIGNLAKNTLAYYNELYETNGAVTLYQKIIVTIADILMQSMDAFEPVLKRLANWFGAKNLSELVPTVLQAVVSIGLIIKLFQILFAKARAEQQLSNDQIVQTSDWFTEAVKLPSSIAVLLKSIKGITDPLKDYAVMISKAFQQLFIIGMAVAIITAISVMALAVFALSLLPWAKLLVVAGVIVPSFAGIMIGTIMALSVLIKKWEKTDEGKGMYKKLATMSSFIFAVAFAFAAMAVAMAILVMLPWDATNWEAVQAGIAIMFGVLIGSAALIAKVSKDASNSEKQMTGIAVMTLAMGVSMILIATAMKKIAKIEPEQMTAAGVIVIAILGLLGLMQLVVLAAVKHNLTDTYYAVGVSITLMAGSVLIAAFALKKIAEVPLDELKTAGIAMGIIFIAITAFVAGLAGLSKLINNAGKDSSNQFVMLMVLTGIMTLVVLSIATALAKIVSTGAASDQVLKAAGAIGIMIAAIGGVIIGMTFMIEKLNKGQVTTMLAVAGSLASVIGAVGIMAYTMGKVADAVDVAKLWAVVGAISVILIVIAGVVFLLTYGASQLAEKSQYGALIVGILALVGGIIATILLGIGLIVFGVGLILKSLVDLANLSDKATDRLSSVLAKFAGIIAGIIAEIFEGIDEGLSRMFGIKGKLSGTIVEFVLGTFETILTKLNDSGILGKLKTFLTKLTHTIGAYIKDNHDIIRESLDLIIGDILTILATHGPRFIDIIDSLLNQIMDNLIQLLSVKGTAFLATIGILNVTIFEILKKMRKDLLDLVFGTISLFLLRMQVSALEFGLAAGNIVFTFIDGLLLAVNVRAPLLMEELALTLILLINSLADTIDEHTEDLTSAIERLLESLYQAFNSWVNLSIKAGGKIFNMGVNIVTGIINGILSKIPMLQSVVNGLAGKGIIQTFMNKTEEHSPSKVFERLGGFLDEGLGKGIKEGMGNIKNIVSELGSLIIGDFTGFFGDPKTMISGFMDGLKEGLMGDLMGQFNINDLMKDFTDLNPVISPELDLSNIEANAGKISDMINPGDIDAISKNFSTPANGMDAVTMQNGFDEMMKKMQNYMNVQNYNNVGSNVNVTLDGDAKKVLKVVKIENNKQIKATGVNQLANA